MFDLRYTVDEYMTTGDYADYVKALDTLDACKRTSRVNPWLAKQLRHEAKQTLATLKARYA